MVHPDNPPYGVVTASAGVSELSKANCTDVDGALHDADEACTWPRRAAETGSRRMAGPLRRTS